MAEGSTLPGWPRALREPLAAAYVGLSDSTFRQVVVPKVAAIKLTTGRVAWLREDLDAWLDSRRPADAKGVDASSGDSKAAPLETFDARSAIAAAREALPPKRGTRRQDQARGRS